MPRFSRHLRGLVVALAVLALSAGGVLAARALPTAPPPDGLKIASDASGHTVPVRAEKRWSPSCRSSADRILTRGS